MCDTKKNCSCGCDIPKKINESYIIDKINDDIISIKDHESDNIVDIERFNDGGLGMIINDDSSQEKTFDSFQDMISFIAQDPGLQRIKKMLFDKNNMKAVFEFVNNQELEPVLGEAIETTVIHDDSKKLTVTYKDPEDTLVRLVTAIQKLGSTGHGFDIIIDPGEDNEQTFYWDGDGGDLISDIDSDGVSDEEEETTGELNEGYKGKYPILYKKLLILDKQFMDNDKWELAIDNELKIARVNTVEDFINKDPSRAIDFYKKWAASPVMQESYTNKTFDKAKATVKTLFKKYHNAINRFNKESGDKFLGLGPAEQRAYKTATGYKNDGWELGRVSNITSDEIFMIFKQAEKEVNDKNKVNEAVKVDLKLSSNSKRELIKKAKTALDALYGIYDMIERQGITSKPFVRNLDNTFEGVNEMLTLLVVQDSVEKK